MELDYGRVAPGFVGRIVGENSLRLSRTRSGVSNKEAGMKKQPLLLDGDALRQRVVENECNVQELVFLGRHDPHPASGSDVKELLFPITESTNYGLLPAGRLRTWKMPYPKEPVADDGSLPPPHRPIGPQALPEVLDHFCQTVFQHWGELATDPVPLAAWSEWHLNAGPLHSFLRRLRKDLQVVCRPAANLRRLVAAAV